MIEFAKSKLLYCADKRAAEALEKHYPYFLTYNERRFLERYNTPEAEAERRDFVKEVNRFTDEVINKDPGYFGKLSSYNLDSDLLAYCL